jgi:hypothetical protein
MSYRQFKDGEGRAWEAWEVHPAVVERRMQVERRNQARPSSDRRGQREFRLVMPRELRAGWLAVQRGDAKLRVAPVPDGWMHLTDAELAELVDRMTHEVAET